MWKPFFVAGRPTAQTVVLHGSRADESDRPRQDAAGRPLFSGDRGQGSRFGVLGPGIKIEQLHNGISRILLRSGIPHVKVSTIPMT